MNHLSRLIPVLLLPALVSCAGEGLDLKTWNAYRNPLVLSDVRHPDVIRDGDTWYLYSDGQTEEGAIQLLSSVNLVDWGTLDPLFDEDTKPGFIPDGVMSGPSILKAGASFLLYYSLRRTDEECGIGVASAPTPTGPWTDHGAVLTASAPDLTVLSHPFAFEDEGTLWLSFGAAGGVYLLRLDATGLEADGEPLLIAEGPLGTPVLYREGGVWYLFSTIGDEAGGASSTAVITVGSSRSLSGPYGDWQNLIGRSAKFAGAGSPARPVLDSEGNCWLLYNAYDLSNLSSGRTLMLDRIHWDGEKVPWVRGNASSFYTDAPLVQ